MPIKLKYRMDVLQKFIWQISLLPFSNLYTIFEMFEILGRQNDNICVCYFFFSNQSRRVSNFKSQNLLRAVFVL